MPSPKNGLPQNSGYQLAFQKGTRPELNKHVLVVGGGAIGGCLTAFLNQAGFAVTLLERSAEVRARIKECGVYLEGPNLSARPAVTENPQELTKKFTYIFLCTRAYHLEEAARSVLPLLGEGGFCISMNNGICLEALEGVAGVNRSAACAIDFGAGIREPGRYFIKIKGGVRLGSRAENTLPLKQLALALSPALRVNWATDILAALYSKMLINACITTGAIATGLPLGDILLLPEGRAVFAAILLEGLQVADELGLRIPPYKGWLSYYRFRKSPLYRALLFFVLRKKYARRTSATLESMKRGAKSETAYYNGYIAHKGRALGVPTPVNERITGLIAEIEAGERDMGKENLALALQK